MKYAQKKQDRDMAIAERKKQKERRGADINARKKKFKRMIQRTKHGQPNMRYRIQDIVSKLELKEP